MKTDIEQLELVLQAIIQATAVGRSDEVPEETILTFLEKRHGTRTDAAEAWETFSKELRNPVVRRGLVLEWNFFRRVIRVTRLPVAEEVERIGELYRLSTPQEIERRIRSLSGVQFERFMGELLARIEVFKNVAVTRISHDGGIDFRGRYVPDPRGPEVTLIGQAKQVASPVSVGNARDFVGALATCGELKPMGLFVSTGGFTDPARETLGRSPYHVMTWAMDELRQRVFETSLGIHRVRVSLEMVDEIFWDEVVGGTKTV